ncbi:MAG: GNAT family N-acetyltransferase [Flavobacteriales bacterium]|nr:GNAT family N-acetyltransferase [Flavobacteriales bacterium]NNK80498.1 GNAT family N-acetyltransferase [Flavobacteriales bacterium]
MRFTEKQIILEDQRVELRPLKRDDLEHLLSFAINEPELWTYSLQQGGGEENLKRYIDKAILDRDNGTSYPFIVYDKKAESYAGSTRFYDIQPEHKTMQLGYTWYGKDYQGTRLNKHCKFLLLEFAFDQLEYERVEFRADAKNARSIAAMKSIGCTVEGILRRNCSSPTGRRDSIVLSILKDEWNDKIRSELSSRLA